MDWHRKVNPVSSDVKINPIDVVSKPLNITRRVSTV